MCLCPLSQDGPHAELKEGQRVQTELACLLIALARTHTETHIYTNTLKEILRGKGSHTPRVRVRAAVIVSMETIT